MNEDDKPQDRTDYDWINGMRIGMIVGAVLGILIGLALGSFPYIWLVVGSASGGYLGAKMAPRW